MIKKNSKTVVKEKVRFATFYLNHSLLISFSIRICYHKFNERVHSDMKTCDKLDYCSLIQPIRFSPHKNAPFCPDRVSVSKFCTSGTCGTPSKDLHHTIRGPASHHPRTCITPSETCITPSVDLHQTMCTWNCYRNLSDQIRIKDGRKWTQSAKSVK